MTLCLLKEQKKKVKTKTKIIDENYNVYYISRLKHIIHNFNVKQI